MNFAQTLFEPVKKASQILKISEAQKRSQALNSIAEILLASKKEILAANQKDLEEAEELSSALKDRLILTEKRIDQMAEGVKAVDALSEVLGRKREVYKHPNGSIVEKERIPLGVIAMIYESRPNVVVEASALAIKSGNALVLKGGKEANYSNECLGNLIRDAISSFIPKDSLLVLDSTNRELVEIVLESKDWIDLVIPRGGQGLINYVYEKATMPVVAHFQGLCHLYVGPSGKKDAIEVILNSKVSRPAVCNALETLLVSEDWFERHGNELVSQLVDAKCELRVDSKTHAKLKSFPTQLVKEEDWETEYLENILSLKIVSSVEEATGHINRYGTHHTEGILSEDQAEIDFFVKSVDASCITINASTRFNDGGELGLGAELGISTSKFHAYGPMGLEQMTTERFLFKGNYSVR